MRHAMTETWVVYRMPVKGTPEGIRGICEQREWDAMELAKPGVNTLIQGGIANEGEAERLARGSSGATPPRFARRVLASWPDAAMAAAAVAVAEPATPSAG